MTTIQMEVKYIRWAIILLKQSRMIAAKELAKILEQKLGDKQE